MDCKNSDDVGYPDMVLGSSKGMRKFGRKAGARNDAKDEVGTFNPREEKCDHPVLGDHQHALKIFFIGSS
eukprot:8409538-Karenia_brevis.AAC.1